MWVLYLRGIKNNLLLKIRALQYSLKIKSQIFWGIFLHQTQFTILIAFFSFLKTNYTWLKIIQNEF